ncbi:myb-related transcription factor, partner of profilin-like [Polyodon spathula]|uniref:myb-related transcription factor, partner of profilin-like n=1 Tax=Polyodon spathula TaxID=7913 RepID=UPI001B7EF6B8|nr:myb-related transcription factor, partner of profilin-like [Polyodon spathula]
MNPGHIKDEDSLEQDWFLSQTEDGEDPELESETHPSNESVPEIICIKEEEESDSETVSEPRAAFPDRTADRTLPCSLQESPAPYAPQRPKTLTPRERKRKFTRRELSVIVQGVLAKTEALFGKNKEALAVRKRVWQDMANQVNALGGPCKRSWHDVQKRFYMYRMGVKQKALALRSAQRGGAGAKPPPGQDLTPMTLEEVRILATWSASALEKGRDGNSREQPVPQAASSSSSFPCLPAPPLRRPDPDADEQRFPSNTRTPPGLAPPPLASSSTPQPRPCPRGAGIPQRNPLHHPREPPAPAAPSARCGRLYSHSTATMSSPSLPSQTPRPSPHPPSSLRPLMAGRPPPAGPLGPSGPQPPSLDALAQVQTSLSQLLQGQAEQARGVALMQQRMEGHMASMSNSLAVLAAVLPDVVRALEGLGSGMGKLAGRLPPASAPHPPPPPPPPAAAAAAAAAPPQVVSSSGQAGGPRLGYSAAEDSEFRSLQQ